MQTVKFSFVAFAIGLSALGSCSSDDIHTAPNQVEGFSPEGVTAFASLEEEKPAASKANTRQLLTTMEHTMGGVGKFKWSAGDNLWVEQSAGTWVKDTKNTIPAAGSATAYFTFNGTYSNPRYNVLYNGNPSSPTTPTQVTILSEQIQAKPNDFSHLGASGDCGYSTATKNAATGDYHFRIAHAATYLCLLPRSGDDVLAGGKVTQIKIATWPFAKTHLAGTFPLSSTGIGTPGDQTADAITLVAGTEGFALNNTNNSTNQSAYYAVVNPGEHLVQLQYSVTAPDGKEYVVNKSFDTSEKYYYPGQVYDITSNLKAMPEGLDKYYFWDAQTGAYAWKQVEGSSVTYPVLPQNHIYSSVNGTGLPTATNDPRSERTTGTAAQNAAINCPTKNQLAWIVWAASKGKHIYVDKTTRWTHLGGIYSFGIWLPKMATVKAITGYTGGATMNNNRALSYGDLPSTSVKEGVPPNTNEYFYLPGIGYTNHNNPKSAYPFSLQQVGAEGFYWSKTRDTTPVVLSFSKLSGKVTIQRLSFFANPKTVAYPNFELQ